MELINTNNENSFDPTPKLKSSPIPILFIPFNNNEYKCNYCGNNYSWTLHSYQKYCKNCLLFKYIKDITDHNDVNTHLDVHIVTKNTRCIEHKATRNTEFCTKNIREWCEHCSEISYFNQIITYYSFYPNTKDRKLCGYLISSGWVESTLAKKPIPVLYLPWWVTKDQCITCAQFLSFVSDCQKWCSRCYLIYTGCRYCLTTNIIFGPTNQFQCRKCKRISIITIKNISNGDHNIDEILYDINFSDVYNCMNNVDFDSPYKVYDFLRKLISNPKMKWIPYSQIENLMKIAEGGFGIVYKATWLDKDVAVKKIFNLQNISKCFLNELKSLYQCYNNSYIIKYIGITQDPKTKECMLIMDYAKGGDLHNYLKKDFTNITWKTKLNILWRISDGPNVKTIHDKNFIHRDFHSGNILLSSNKKWLICDLGLSQPANNTSNNEIYGVIPYIAPEIFKGAAFSKESDTYSMGMIMWELTTGCKPFADVEHNADLIYEIIDGKRPEITNDTPEPFANLMKRCWDSDPLKRPSISFISNTVYSLYCSILARNVVIKKQFEQAEERRIKLMQSGKLGPKFSKKPHSKAVFTSRPLNSLVSKSSYSSSMITFNTKQEHIEYFTREHELDINNVRSSTSQNINSIQNSRHSNAISTVNFSSSSRKRNIEELKIEIQNNESISKLIGKTLGIQFDRLVLDFGICMASYFMTLSLEKLRKSHKGIIFGQADTIKINN